MNLFLLLSFLHWSLPSNIAYPGKPITLQPLEFDEAVSDLLKVKPEEKGKHEKDKGEDK